MMRRTPLKRSTPLRQGSPMKRSEWKRSACAEAPRKTTTKRRRPKNAPTQAESFYMGKVAELGCVLCRHLGFGPTPAIVHHQRTGQGAKRASHYRTAPLCPPHHQHSGYGVHDMGRPQFEAMYGISEVALVERTRAELADFLPPTETA